MSVPVVNGESTYKYEGGTGPESIKYVSSINEGIIDTKRGIKCTWRQKNGPKVCPHTRVVDWKQDDPIYTNILHAVGNTKLVRLNRIPQSLGVKCEILVKCEFLNPGGSVKDRIGLRMVEDAERQGLLKPGATLIEPTSGNTGVGIALAAAVKGYRCIIVMSEKMSNEKVAVLKALGAEIVRVPITETSDSPNGLFGVSSRLKKQIPNSLILDQYTNPGNPLAHYDTTAEEILHGCDGRVDIVVAGAGTGGSVTGLGRKIKELSPGTLVVAVDPVGSVMARPESLNVTDKDFYEVEGLGYDFIPASLDHKVIDKWIKVDDPEAFTMARRLIKEEGLLCGGSSGSAMVAALQLARNLKEGQRIVVILPDSIRNYLTKFVSDSWMEAKGFKPAENPANHWWWDTEVSKLNLKSTGTVTTEQTCAEVIEILNQIKAEEIPIADKSNSKICGVACLKDILSKVTDNRLKVDDKIEKGMSNIFGKVLPNTNLGLVSKMLDVYPCVIVYKKEGQNEKLLGVVKPLDILTYIAGIKAQK